VSCPEVNTVDCSRVWEHAQWSGEAQRIWFLLPELVVAIGNVRGRNLVGVNDLHPTVHIPKTTPSLSNLGSHYSHLSRRPRIVDITSHVFGVHHAVSTAVCLASDHRNLWYGCLSVRKDQLRAVPNYTVVLLVRSCTAQYPDNVVIYIITYIRQT